MPDLPALALADPPSIAEVYSESLYNPAATTLEILNGGLDANNFNGTIPGYAIRRGSFVCWSEIRFRQLNWVYAIQTAPDGQNGVVLPLLVLDFMLPWQASLVVIRWAGWFRHDATLYDASGSAPLDPGPHTEYWDLLTYLDSTELVGGRSRLWETRATQSHYTNAGAYQPPAWTDPGFSAENRWRWCSAMTRAVSVTRGRHQLALICQPKTFGVDPWRAKILVPTGQMSVIAYR